MDNIFSSSSIKFGSSTDDFVPITATAYTIELRDKNGHLKQYITPFVSRVTWEWNRLGGCGRCSITINKRYRDIIFDARDDIQIRVKSGITTKLVYRGYIANIVPTLKINQDIVLDVRGYFDLFKKIIINDTGDTKTYTASDIHVIVDSIIDTFIVPNTNVTKGTIDTTDGSSFTVNTMDFLCTVETALRTLSDLAGDAEYGVDEDLVFFWRTESSTINHKFFVGNNVSVLERRVNWDELVNRIYLIGGDVLGVKYKYTAEATDSQDLYYLSENIVNNSSITTDEVAAQYCGAILTEKSIPQFSIRGTIKNTDIRLEDTIPMGLVSFYDAYYDLESEGDVIGDIIGAESAITSSSVANPSVITATNHGYLDGETVIISGHTGSTPSINGTHVITYINANSFSIPVNVTVGGTGGVATSDPENGSDIRIGETADGGDNVFVGGQYSAQVDRISYSLSNTPGRFNIEIQLGDTVLETAAKIKRLELALNSIQQGV